MARTLPCASMDKLTDLRSWLEAHRLGKWAEFAIALLALFIALYVVRAFLLVRISNGQTRYHARKALTFLGYVLAIILAIRIFSQDLSGVGVALGVVFLSQGTLETLMLMLMAALLPAVCDAWRSRRYAVTLLAAVIVAAPLLLVWPLALHAPTWVLYCWQPGQRMAQLGQMSSVASRSLATASRRK